LLQEHTEEARKLKNEWIHILIILFFTMIIPETFGGITSDQKLEEDEILRGSQRNPSDFTARTSYTTPMLLVVFLF